MKKITGILFVMVIVVGVLSTSGCDFLADSSGRPGDVGYEAKRSTNEAKNMALAHVKKRMAEISPELSQQVTMSWIGEPVENYGDNVYDIAVHAPTSGQGASGIPDFTVRVAMDTKYDTVYDDLPSNWASKIKSNFN